MITLNELLAITEVKRYTVYVPLTPKLRVRVDAPEDSSELEELAALFGERRVRRVSPAYKGDDRLVVELRDATTWNQPPPGHKLGGSEVEPMATVMTLKSGTATINIDDSCYRGITPEQLRQRREDIDRAIWTINRNAMRALREDTTRERGKQCCTSTRSDSP